MALVAWSADSNSRLRVDSEKKGKGENPKIIFT
jgi:hypothetical protein